MLCDKVKEAMQPALNAVAVCYTEGLLSSRPLSPTLTLINPDPIPNSNLILWDCGPPVADPGMGGPGGRPLPPPLTKLMAGRLVVAARSSLPQTQGQVFI